MCGVFIQSLQKMRQSPLLTLKMAKIYIFYVLLFILILFTLHFNYFWSLFHFHLILLTDLPTIVSGNRIAYLEPHEEIWKGQSGQWYPLSECAEKTDTLAPFENLCGFSSTINAYEGTLFRFPLRNVKQDKRVSYHVYDIAKLHKLLTALREEAKFILLFLRSVIKIEVHEIAENGSYSCLFEVNIQEVSQNTLAEKRAIFQQQLKHSFETQSFSITRQIELVVHVEVHVTDYQQQENNSKAHWLAASMVGSNFQEVHITASALKVLPWVGVALELNRAVNDCGRVFCVLPMPPDVCCHLPVHVNGTFSLNDERRALKWQGLETRNDNSAKWNSLIITHLLPRCYASLLVEHAKMLLKPNDFFLAWPKATAVIATQWEGLLKPLFEMLFFNPVHPVLWSQHPQQKRGLWIQVKSAIFASPSCNLPEIVSIALWECRERIVSVPERVWDALKYLHICIKTVTPQLTRSKLREYPNSYVNFTHGQKTALLKYCLSDEPQASRDLSNLGLLPLANDTFTTFRARSYLQILSDIYLCSSEYPRYLLPNVESELVDIQGDPELFRMLKVVATNGHTQLKLLQSVDVASLLPRCMPHEWKYQHVVTLPHPSFPKTWMELFWKWVSKHKLSLFLRQLVVPVLATQSDTLDITRLGDNSPTVFIPSTTECSPFLISALSKFHVRCCLQIFYPYLQHYSLYQLMNTFSADGILNAINCASHFSVPLSNEEAKHLRQCLIGWKNSQNSSILMKLPIFFTLLHNGNCLYSVNEAKQKSIGRNANITPSNCPLRTESLPSNLILFSDSDYYQNQLLQSISISRIATIDLVLSLLHCFQKGQLTLSCVQCLMREVLENYNRILSREHQHKNNLNSVIRKLSFLPTSRGTISTPESLFSPLDPKLQELFKGESVFPVAPFTSERCVNALQHCGLKTTVSPQEIVNIIGTISFPLSYQPVVVEGTKYARAKAVLDYVSNMSSQKFDENVTFLCYSKHVTLKFSQALKDLSQTKCWLPVKSEAPKCYPDCLVWKGSNMTSHFITFGPSVLLHHNQASFANICGSQMFFVDHSLPVAFCNVFSVSIQDLQKHILAHFEEIILNENKIKDVKAITYQIYEQLHYFYYHHGCNIQLSWMQKTQKYVWIQKCKKFVHPDIVALKHNPTFRQNLEPFIWTIPDDLEEYSSLFEALGVNHCITEPQIIGILEKIKEGNSASLNMSNQEAWQLVMNILNWITSNGEQLVRLSYYNSVHVPIVSDSDWPVLCDCKDVVYTDNDFLRRYLQATETRENNYIFVHHKIYPQLAYNLRLTPLSEHLKLSEDAFEDVGQSEPLTVRLKNILKDYKDGLTIIKELLQNADDAGATEMNICYDTRQHAVTRDALFFPGMAECHGPALLVHNDAKFTQDDFKNITRLAGATKEGKRLKIGKFGIGFCSVYHITDVPSFVSDNLLYIFDPTLSYLKDEIKNPSKPGKKVTFTSHLISKSQQLLPYRDVFGFDPHETYEGTMFRFPFRHTTSELSGKIYTADDIKELFQDIQFYSSKFLLFLQSVKSLSVSQFDSGATHPRKVVKITSTMQTIGCSTASVCQVTCIRGSSEIKTDFWLVETYTNTVLSQCSVASVACSLMPNITPPGYKVQELEGEMFCFLPMSVKTGLPVHVSSNFAVSNNRRGIWTSDDDSRMGSEVKWNETLMKHTIPIAYYRLLEAIKTLCIESKLDEYSFFSLWPLKENLKLQNPWSNLVEVLYKHITSSELFFSASIGEWLSLGKSRFLSSDILKVSPNDTEIAECIFTVAKILGLAVVHLSIHYRNYINVGSSMLTERQFLHHFFVNIDKFDSIIDTRNEVLFLAIESLAIEHDRNQSRFDYLQDYLESNACVPCVPDGLLLRKCCEVIDPKALFSKLFDDEEQVFPLQKCCERTLVNEGLKLLGMLQNHLPPKVLMERANSISSLYKRDEIKACMRVKGILDYLTKQLLEPSSNAEYRKLADIPFLPVMSKPDEYPLVWFGDQKKLCSGRESYMKGKYHQQTDNTNANIAGSQLLFVCQQPPQKGGCGLLNYNVQETLSISMFPSHTVVISHFMLLIETFTLQQPSSKLIEWTDRMSRQVYEFLDDVLKKRSVSFSEVPNLSSLCHRACIWTKDTFVKPSCVAAKWKQNGPYLYCIPTSIASRKYLQDALQIKETFTTNDYRSALQNLERENRSKPIPEKCQKLVQEIISEVLNTKDIGNEQYSFMLPDTDYVMHEPSHLYFNNTPWLPPEETHIHVNDIVPLALAKKLGVQDSKFKVLPFGQHEVLTRRIGNILRDYPFDVTILKELLQNADDAKANKVYVILDKRQHKSEHVLSEEWKNLHGPALLVWNDSEFSDKDLEGIQELGLGSKRSDAETIGQYGIGFNAVYHLTDCPSFVTGGNTLCILDPHCRYVPESSTKYPGRMFKDLDEGFWKAFDSLQTIYLRSGLENRPKEILNGSLFRFPIRHSLSLVMKSEIMKQLTGDIDRVVSAEYMDILLTNWAPIMKHTLFFLNHVTELKFFVIEKNSNVLHQKHCYKTEFGEEAFACRSLLSQKINMFRQLSGSGAHIAAYTLTIVEKRTKKEDLKEKWLVQQGVGDVDNEQQRWLYVNQVKPRHGIATPFIKAKDIINGQVFCFLPLPICSGLPVHVNGNFILNSTRRNLWSSTVPDAGDEKCHWNQCLIEAIASSYAHFLVKIEEIYSGQDVCISKTSIEKSINDYYKCFPKMTSESPAKPWHDLAQYVFQTLVRHNLPVLAVLKEVPVVSTDAYANERSKKKASNQPLLEYSVEWHPLINNEEPSSQVFFWEGSGGKQHNVRTILERIGVKITCAPLWIRNRFKNAKLDIPIISPVTIFQYYMNFHSQILAVQSLPCSITTTPFLSVDDFKSFSDYLLTSCESSSNPPTIIAKNLPFPQDPFGYPLLLTADGNLRLLEKKNKVLYSKCLHLFPTCQERFLHKNLLELPYSSTYFLSSSDDEKIRVKVINDLLQTILPDTLKTNIVHKASDHIKHQLLKQLWQCLAFDAIFASVLQSVIKDWALLLSTNNCLFRYECFNHCLPIVPYISSAKDSSTMMTLWEIQNLTNISKVSNVLKQLPNVPFLDTDVVPHHAVFQMCPRFSEPRMIFKNLLYIHKMSDLSKAMTKESVNILIKYFASIGFTTDVDSCDTLKHLPFFETIEGTFTELTGKRVFVWPSRLPRTGCKNWLSGTDAVFLETNGAWAALHVQSKLKILALSAENVYIQFVFPNFFKLDKAQRFCHLKHIRDFMFTINNVNQNSRDYNTSVDATRFISALQNLHCLENLRGILEPIKSFCNHEKIIFSTFPDYFHFLPPIFKTMKKEDFYEYSSWMDFFTKLKLRESPTAEEFCAMCSDTANGKFEAKTKQSSSTLISYLLSSEERPKHRLFCDSRVLRKIANIPFVCSLHLPNLEWIHPVCQTENRILLPNKEEVQMCNLSSACSVDHKELVWTVKPVVDLTSDEINDILCHLNMHMNLTNI